MARIRTLNFLPEVFQTPSNAEFLAATLDQIVNPPSAMKIQGYVGSKLGYGVNANDQYVPEPSKERTDYQLEPGVVFTKANESVAQDFITYPGIVNAVNMQGGITDNNSRLFTSQFYSWDSFTDLDKLINYNQYYWLPDGPPSVTVASSIVYQNENYTVTDLPNGYNISVANAGSGSINPTLTLLRGGTYTFTVNQATQFFIQGEPGTSGYSPTQPNLPVRDVYGVSNNGATDGIVTFNVPDKDAQNQYNFEINNVVDVVSTMPFDQVNGQLLSDVGNIDGVTGLEGLRVVFYDTGIVDEIGYTSSYFAETQYDTNDNGMVAPLTLSVSSCDSSAFTLASGNTSVLRVGNTVTFSGVTFGGINIGQVYYINNIVNNTSFSISLEPNGATISLTASTGTMTVNINQGLYEEGYYSVVADNYYRIQYIGGSSNPILRLVPDGTINENEKITPALGIEFANRPLFKNNLGAIQLIPYITAPLTTLYYQDGTSADKVGIIRIIDSNYTNTLNVTTDIIGHKNFTSTNGVTFTNGLKVQFDGDVIPTSYLQGEYYVEGVGTAIELIPVNQLVCPEKFTQGAYVPWDMAGWDIGNYDINLYLPVLEDYITIARNSISKNAWSRSNRWFHIDVINATATYNNNPDIINIATGNNKAKRPIIEFYPNLKLWNSGTIGKAPVDFIDTRNTDALSNVAGSVNYYPDTQVYTTANATILYSATPVTSIPVTVPVNAVTGNLVNNMFIGDFSNILPHDAMITELSSDGTDYVMTVSWETPQVVNGDNQIQLVASATTLDNYALFSGSRIIFAADNDRNVRNKIYVAELSTVTPGSPPVITLTVAEDGDVMPDTEVVITRGYNNQGLSYWYDGLKWNAAQDKLNVNQAPLFDLYDSNGISLGDNDYYSGTSFAGCKLFAYGIGTGTNDSVLGFPIKYSSVANIGDISFDISLNSDTFSYVQNGNPITENVNVGYVYNYTSGTDHVRQLGWQNAVAPSTQYQVFNFEYDINNPVTYLQCDIAALPDLINGEKGWPRVKVFYNNVYQYGGYSSGALANADYTYSIGTNTTTITLINKPSINTPIQVMVLSDQVSNIAYYDVPLNLTNNPLNQDLTTANIGDIRLQYRDIFINSPLLSGEIFGPNNYRDCGDLVPYGTEIIQNSAAMVLPGAFLRNPAHNLFDALLFNSREYIKFKQLIVDTVQNTDYTQRYTPSTILDAALDQIAAARSEYNAFFWSDMLPSKSPYISNTYTFNNELDHTIFPLSQVYDFTAANYNGVLVYLQRTVDGVRIEKQLLSGFDYTISSDSPSLSINIPLLNGDNIVIKEYNQTYGSYVPNTPTKLGVYPSFEPAVVLDSDYIVPTYFIRGHDGSYTKLYGEYNADLGLLIDFRDQALLEFESRIYNNLKLSNIVPIRDYEIIPGYFRQNSSTYTYDEFLEMYSPAFLNWVGQNRLDYKTQYYSKTAEFTYNYTNSAYKTNNQPIQQGYWRGVYSYLYDTTAPNETPWEMLGFTIMPDWWTSRYGPAPYTSDNGILWADLEAGLVWNNGSPYIIPELARPGLSQVIPVDSAGNLLSPFKSVVGNYNPSTFQKDWKVGDMAPVELSYRRSSTWPFDLVRLFALTRPAEFYNLAVDLDAYKYNTEFNQYLVNDRRHLQLSDINVYGSGTAVTSYINWIVDYEKQQGIDATTNITTMLNNMDVRLIYRLAGYSDKTMLNFYVEKGSPNSRNASLLIPDESYSVLLYENQPFDRIMFSGVVVQQNQGYWTVYGNSQNFAYFKILNPKFNGQWKDIAVEKQKVKVAVDYETTTTLIPYGTKFYSTQDVSQFLLSYGAYLESQGMIFDDIQNGVHVTWNQMVLEFLYWTQTGWENGSLITLNPAAQDMNINPASAVVQPLTIHQQNFILNQNLYPIQLNDLCVNRDDTNFHVHTLNSGDTMAYGQFNISNFEHGIVFDNTTLFNDVLYSTVTGLRQNRIYVRGTKTAEWNGTVDTWGFILNQDNVQQWDGTLKYTKGVIVQYKNKYWTSLKVIEPSMVFNELDWKQINYGDIQKGLLANPSTRAYESTLYYNVYEANLEQDADLLSFSLIGYRPRDYLALIDLTDTAQVQVYQNLIKNKGTKNAVDAFKGANLPQGGIKYDVYENWAIQSGSYGGVLNENFVDFRINQKYMTGDPSIVSLTNGIPTEGSMQEIQLANLYDYGVAPTSPNVLNTTTPTSENTLYPSAGYVNYNDVKMATYFYAGLPYATDVNGKIIPIQNFYVGEYMWMANFKEKWGVYRWKPIGQVLQVRGNANQTATITFDKPHGLKKLDPVAIVNFATNVDGYYLVNEVVSLYEVIINLSLVGASNGSIQGRGLGFSFESQRVATPSEIATLNLTENEFVKNTVWVDENYDGSWAVYRKSINYQPQGQLEDNNYGTYGSSVAYTSTSGYLVSDPANSTVYRYGYDSNAQSYSVNQTLTGTTSFGSYIAYAGSTYAVSQPTGTPTVSLYAINNSILSDDMIPYQAPIGAPAGVTNWGSKLAMSDDTNWLYVSDTGHAKVYVYRKQNIPLTAGYFVPGETYTITGFGDQQSTQTFVNQIGDGVDAIYPTGVTRDTNGFIYNIAYDYYNGGVYLMKYNTLGEIVYQVHYAGVAANQELVIDDSNHLYTTFNVTNTTQTSVLAKISNIDGSIIWQKSISDASHDITPGSLVYSNGFLYQTLNRYIDSTNTYTIVSKYNATNGSLIWQRKLTAPVATQQFSRSIDVDASGNVYVTVYDKTNSIGYLVKYTSTGSLIWQTQVGSLGFTNFISTANNNLVMTSHETATANIMKLDPNDGSIIWQRYLGELAGGTEFAYASTSDEFGNIYFVGEGNYGLFGDMLIAKYDTLGNLIFQRTLNSGNNIYEDMYYEGRTSIEVKNDLMLFTGFVLNGSVVDPIVAQLPSDGSLTGQQGIWQYLPSSFTVGTGSLSVTAGDLTDAAETYSTGSSSIGSPTTSSLSATNTDFVKTDFTQIGAIENKLGIVFVATGIGAGEGTATQITYKLASVIDGTALGLSSSDNFGAALATTNRGNTLIVGAPNVDYSGSILNWGAAYTYARTEQNYEVLNNSSSYQTQNFTLAWTPNNIAGKASTTITNSKYINVSSTTGLTVNMPVFFTGSNFGTSGIQSNVIYYVAEINSSTKFSIKTTRNTTTPVALTNATGLSFTAYAQNNPLYVTVNGILVDDSNYATIGNTFYYVNNLNAGDIVNVSDSQFYMMQELNSQFTDRTDIHYATSVDITKYGSDVVVGSPYEINTNNEEGAVYSYINGGAKYGVVIGTSECNVTTSRTVLINGYMLTLTAGNAASVAQQINSNNIINVEAAATIDNKLIIQLVDNTLSPVDEKLVITVFSDDVLSELGLQVYTNTQVITCPHNTGPTQFGTVVKINEAKSMLVSAPVGTRYEGTVFDFTDDENLDNDTLFDNNATQFVDSYPNAGAVYMFDYLSNSNESLAKPGAFVYAQSVNDNSTDYGYDPGYGLALDFNENIVLVGSPNYQPYTVGGKAVVYNNSVGLTDWIEYRQSAPVVDIDKIQNTQLYSASSNNTLVNFDYPDPLQNKLLGAVRENLDYITGIDPANYNVNYAPQSGMVWGADHVGKMWFNTTNVRWMNYHQNDVVYNSRHWAQVFPGSDVAVYTWIASYVLPVNYQGPGTPYDVNQYAVNSIINASGVVVPVYYYWVRNTNIIAEQLGKTLSDTIVASYIANPRGSGIPFMAPLLPNTFAMYNSGAFFNANDTVFHIGYANGTSTDVSHTEYALIRTDYADDFLPGLPSYANGTYGQPYSLYAKLLDSLAGADQAGNVVPNPLLPLAVQQGVLNIPRQSFFYDRYAALDNYLSYANTVMAQYPITEIKEELSFLFTSGEFYNTSDYWEYINWYAPGYNTSTQTSIQVSVYGDLAALTNVATGTLVKVEKNGAGKYEIYRYDGSGVWTRVGLQNGTIQFKNYLWNYAAGKLGFSGNFFDTDSFDAYPAEVTRNVVRALNEQIYTGELLIHRNKSLILMFEFIQSETIESQNFLPWLNKTSLADVSHTIRELKPYEVYKTDDQVFLSEYINEAKPYHVVIKDFLFNYTGTEVYQGNITDFDVPATYNSTYQQFISPELVYTSGTNNRYEYTHADNIWQTAPYTEWFKNYGLSMGNPVYQNGTIIDYVGQSNYPITTLSSYVTLGTKYMIVDNANGFPINGTITIGNEKIGYSYVDHALNLLGGLTRGVDGTTIVDHLPGEQLYIDLPAVLVLSGGRGYSNPPKVTAVIDTTIFPEPTVAAQFEAVMNLDSVLEIKVTNPGQGYAVLPEIVVEPGIIVDFTSADIVPALNTLRVFAPDFRTGDLVQYKAGTGSGVGGLANNQWYYVNVLETAPSTIIALYTTYGDAILDQHRVDLSFLGTGTGMTLNLGAKAIAITQSTPTRELNTTIKFDRTSYQSQIQDWQSGTFYGAYFAGSYYNTDNLSSTNITLENTAPNINDLLASAHNVVFEVVDVANEEQVAWSSFVRDVKQTLAVNNIVRLTPLDGNNPDLSDLAPNASGTTVGFYKNMPIKFGGATIGGIVNGQVYYVSEVLNEIDFTISATIDGSVLSLTSATVGAPMYCYTGQVIDQAVLTVNYPGIMTATATTAVTNAITIPLSAIGTGGTNGFYPGITLFFTATNDGEAMFGNLIENQVYYVNTIIDEQTFTISETSTSVTTNINNQAFTNTGSHVIYSTMVTGTATGTNIVTVDSTADFAINDKIIFNSMVIGGNTVTSFGNIVSGSLYYVSEIINDTEMKISTSVNGAVFTLANATGTAMVTNQKNTVTLTTSTGTVTANVALPVSPGQVNGQKFSMYQTSQEYPNINTGVISNLLHKTTYAAIGTNFSIPVNRLAVDDTTWIYANMPFQLQDTVGGLSSGTTYYVSEYSGMEDPLNPGTFLKNIYLVANTTIAGTATPGTNKIVCSGGYNTASLYEGMPIIFSGVGLGGINIGQEYYVKVIVDSTHFTISDTPAGAEKSLSTDSGTMAGTGSPWITVSATAGGSVISLTTDTLTTPVELDQIITSVPMFDMSYILGGYRAIIQNGGSGFAITNTITIPGTLIGGTSPANDAKLEVNTIDQNGTITSLIINGTPAGTTTDYYFKIRGSNQFEVYKNSLLTIPASGLDFAYVGFTTTNATSVTASNNRITVDDSTMFAVNDPVVFTGNVFTADITLGQTYYIKTIPTATTVTLSNTPSGTTLDITVDATGSMTMAKAGSFAFLNEPFYFAPSIIRFNNRLYTCLISNNDAEFVLGKWELIDSGDRHINAMDRAVGYYQPTANMPGRDLTQLFTGITYPNSTYVGNAFEPSQQFDLDVVLQDQIFYPTNVQLNGIVYTDGYYAAANLPDYSALVYSADGNTWLSAQLTSSNVNFTNIVFANDTYIMTSTNPATPIYRSNDGRQWTTNGTYTPWGTTGWSENNYDSTSLETSSLALQSATYFNRWIAVGDNIIVSDDTYTWREVKTYLPGRNTELYGIATANTGQFNGVVAVGQTTTLEYNNSLPVLNPVNLITWSSDGLIWNDIAPLTSKSLYSVASNNAMIIAVGMNGVMYYSYNGSVWYGLNEASVTSFSSTNNIISISQSGFQVGDAIQFNNTFSSIVAGTTYYVKSVVSPTLITISATNGGPTKTLTAGTVPANTIVYSYGNSADLRDITYAMNTWVAVGDNGTIKTSPDGVIWTTQSSGTTENLNRVDYAASLGSFIVTGDNNTIITSTDNGVTWTSISLFEVLPALHTVKGADFPYGYGPEELVPGVVKDNLNMTVITRPGTNWPDTVYSHTGYNVVSYEYTPVAESQTVYSFDVVSEYTAQIFVQVLNATSGLGKTLYQGVDYTVDWQNKLVILNSPLSISPMQKLRIDLYEVGNGDQLVKSVSDIDPYRIDDATGFNEIYVNCNYSATIYQGSGVIRPGTFDRSIVATATEVDTNRITCETVVNLVLGEPITFSGDLLGGLQPNVTYYIKSISVATDTITVSNYYDVTTGVAGATVPLTTDAGTMYVNLSIGSDQVWTAPILYNNGVKQVPGYSSQVTQTVASNNSIIANSTGGMAPGAPVVFSNTMFGGVIQPLTQYYVLDVLSPTSFTISETPLGSVVALTDALGGADYITYDYAFGIQPNGISAKIIFPTNQLSMDTNYIVYSLFGETQPQQYGYTIPETQLLVGNGSTKTFNLVNYLGEDNTEYAIVEINGLRVAPSTYTIDSNLSTITFVTAPANGSNIAITTFNDTSRQYMSVQTNNTFAVTAISNVNNVITAPLAIAVATASSSTGNKITVNSTTNFVVGQTVEFRGTSFGGIATNGTVYFVDSIVDGTHFTIKNAAGSQITLTNSSGSIEVIVGGNPTVRVTTSTQSGLTTNTLVRIDGLQGSTQLNNNVYYVRVITPYVFDLYEQPFSASLNAVNYPVTTVSNYVSGGYVWEQGVLYLYSVTATSTNGTVKITASGDVDDLALGTPVYFAAATSSIGDDVLGGLLQGTEYYVHTVYSETEFSVSATRGGDELTLSSATGTVFVTQWNQQNVDRIWVTVNGYRVPSSKLRLNNYNEVSILTTINTGDVIVINNMVPTATPREEIYMNLVDDQGVPSVYRVPAYSKTYLMQDVYPLSTEIQVGNVYCVVNTNNETVTATTPIGGYYTYGLPVNKRLLTSVTVYNLTTGKFIDSQYVSTSLQDTAPIVKITAGSWINTGDTLEIVSIEGGTALINGEQITFTGVNLDTNTLTGVQRGTNGTGNQGFIAKNTTVYGLLDTNKLSDVYYNQTWNSYVYDAVNGDPLQISDTTAAQFLNPENG